MNFWLGTFMASWLKQTDVPLMVSHRKLRKYKTMPRARGPWVLDSGGFSELSMYGEWQVTPQEYAGMTRRYQAECGQMEWAAIQDWMCEPHILAKTGLTIHEHQLRSVVSMVELTMRAPEITWTPVLQGWEPDDYLRHADMYVDAGVDLAALPVVGIGSVCRRQGVRGAVDLIVRLSQSGIRLHGFGLKKTAIQYLASFLHSADSMAWSYQARKRQLKCGTPPTSCWAHMHYALDWRADVLETRKPLQLGLGV